MAVGPLLAVFSFLPGRAGAVGTRYILLFLGFGFHLAVVLLRAASAFEDHAAPCDDVVDVTHNRYALICVCKFTQKAGNTSLCDKEKYREQLKKAIE